MKLHSAIRALITFVLFVLYASVAPTAKGVLGEQDLQNTINYFRSSSFNEVNSSVTVPGNECGKNEVFTPSGKGNISLASKPKIDQVNQKEVTSILDENSPWECYEEGGPACYSNLESVEMISEEEGWAVGHGGIILHYTNSEWQRYNMPVRSTLYDIDMISSIDGWAVGFDFGNQKALTLHWDGNNWAETINPSNDILYSLSMISSSDGWAVGGAHYDWDNNTWWGTTLHWDGTEWKEVKNPAKGRIHAIDAILTNDVWAVGWDVNSGAENESIIIHWNGSNWSTVNNPTSEVLNDISMLSTNDGWAVGNNGATIHWDGSQWQLGSGPTGILHSVIMIDHDNVWVST